MTNKLVSIMLLVVFSIVLLTSGASLEAKDEVEPDGVEKTIEGIQGEGEREKRTLNCFCTKEFRPVCVGTRRFQNRCEFDCARKRHPDWKESPCGVFPGKS